MVAIKQMQEDLTPAERAFAHALFIREAALLSDLAHPGIPALFGHLQEAQPQTLVMEFVPGVTLELLLQQSMLTLAEVCDSGIQLCAILDYLHRQCSTIIHRDLKPANVLRRPDGSIVLVDFGIARRCTTTVSKTTASRWRSGQPTHRVCDTLVNLGTMGYAAPEQYGEAAQTTPRSDLFSLGVILHRMLSGEDPAAQAKRVRFLTLFRFSSLAGRTHPELADLVASLVQVDPQLRPGNAADVQQVLRTISLDLHSVPGNRRAPQFFSLTR